AGGVARHGPRSVSAAPARPFSDRATRAAEREAFSMLLLIVLAIIVLAFVTGGFLLQWLFIAAAIVALIWLISLFTGGYGGVGARGWSRRDSSGGAALRGARHPWQPSRGG